MAYTPTLENSMKIPVEPAVLGPIRITRAASATNVVVKIPWSNVRLVYAYANTTTVVVTLDFNITLQLNAAAGTEMAKITLPTSSSAVGDTAEWVVSSAAACKNLGRQDTSRDAINFTFTGDAGAAAGDVYLYFEPELGQP